MLCLQRLGGLPFRAASLPLAPVFHAIVGARSAVLKTTNQFNPNCFQFSPKRFEVTITGRRDPAHILAFAELVIVTSQCFNPVNV